MDQKVVYYSDELNDDFAGVSRDTITIDHNFKYKHSWLWNFFAFILYRIIMTPVAYFYMKIKFHMKVENAKVLKQGKSESYFMYGNHTQLPGDGYIPTILNFPKGTFCIVNADNISLKGTQTFMTMIGATPLPNQISGMRNFMDYIASKVSKKKGIAIYPEAHIWPYYTKIRPFKEDSFRFPIMHKTKAFCFTTTYQKRKNSDKPNITVYVDGPFEADLTLGKKESQKKMRDEIYNTMVQRSKNSTYEYVTYRRCDKNTSLYFYH